MKAVVITGVSTGIGFAAAEALLKQGFRVFGSVRREQDAERVSAALGEGFEPLVFDVTDTGAVRAARELVQSRVGDAGLWGLVNNAGIGGLGPLMHVPESEIRAMFETNVFGLLGVTREFLPLLGGRFDAPHPPGRIVNISSTSGRIAFPMMGPYSASKYAVEALSDSLRRELMLYGIDVIVVEPGAIRTPIWDKGEADVPARYAGTDYAPVLERILADVAEQKAQALPVSRISRVIVKALTASRPKARYAVPHAPLTRWIVPRWLPARWFDVLIRHHLQLRRFRAEGEQRSRTRRTLAEASRLREPVAR